MQKPAYWGAEYATWFRDAGVVAAYRYRPPYPDEVFDVLMGLVVDSPKVVLDIGAGTGGIARRLAGMVERVDAVDFSPGMIEEGQGLPGGGHPNLCWIMGKVEEATMAPQPDQPAAKALRG